MACPFFFPTRRLEQRLWPHPARLPLGDGFAGRCCAVEGTGFEPGENALKDCCNLGYARRHCGRFPETGAGDAVRFAVASDDRRVVRIYYVIEKNHRPHEHGPLEFDLEVREFRNPPSNRILARQAEVYVESYLRRTHVR